MGDFHPSPPGRAGCHRTAARRVRRSGRASSTLPAKPFVRHGGGGAGGEAEGDPLAPLEPAPTGRRSRRALPTAPRLSPHGYIASRGNAHPALPGPDPIEAPPRVLGRARWLLPGR